MDGDATTSDSRAAEPFDPDLIHAIFKLVWRRQAATRTSTSSLLRRPRGEIGVQLPMQARLKSAVNFCAYLLQRLSNVLLSSLRRRTLPSSNPPI